MIFEYLIVFINSSFTFCFLTERFDNNLKNILRLLCQVKHVQTSRYLTKKERKMQHHSNFEPRFEVPKSEISHLLFRYLNETLKEITIIMVSTYEEKRESYSHRERE